VTGRAGHGDPPGDQAIAVRGAAAADAPLLATLHAPCFPEEPWPAAALATLLDSPGVFGLIAGSGDDQGFILCRTAADEAEVLTLAVLPQCRRAGVGGCLMASGLARAAAQGGRTMFLEVAEDNPAALALYSAAGFATVGRRPGYYRRGDRSVAAVVLSRDLSA
jgi:ribosomal-protein-alanine N-acetyltransferase